MKCYIFFFVFFIVSWGNGGAQELGAAARNDLKEKLLAFFDMWLKGESRTALPLPPLDVISIPKLEGSFKESGIKLSYATSDMKLTGLNQSYIQELEATESADKLAARGRLVAPSLMLYAEKYKLDGSAYFFYPIKGAGELWANFHDCVLAFDIQLGTNGKRTWVQELQFEANLGKIAIEMSGTSYLNKYTLNSKAPGLFAKYRKDMEAAMTEAVIPFLNYYLTDMSFLQILDLITDATKTQPEVILINSI
ncbi:uncharacterized protein LOC106136928 [Amyelois transitella]|uniref:uncharacterized protein LOC106136928 n=1 Tax=Amyelois transitella TaxID=680683 RepID=UPI00067D1D5A|nr:uncharacterized protein LOC106136928 [Amyelois transitella]